MKGNERRMEDIFRLLRQGLRADQIDAYFAEKSAHGRRAVELGVYSEGRVQELLSGLPYVREAVILSSNKREDRKKHDLRVVLHPAEFITYFHFPLVIPEQTVWVQVKSSRAGVNHYLQQIQAANNLLYVEALDWMRQHRHIIVNMAQREDKVLHNFESQLHAMNVSWSS